MVGTCSILFLSHSTNPQSFRSFQAAALHRLFLRALRSSPSERTTFGTCARNDVKRLHTDEPGRGAGRWPSSPRGLRSWFALRRRSRSSSSTVCPDHRVVEAVSLHADRNAHGEWWSPCAFRSASSDSQQSALGTAQTSDEKAVKKERPHGFSLG